MSDSDEQQKQLFLRENILDKGYEAEDFVSYLTSKKGDEGIDLNNWSLEELKSVVNEFISSQYNNYVNDGNDFDFIEHQSQQIPTNFPQFNNVENIGEQPDLYGITNTEIINCLKQEKTKLNKNENIKIEIILGEKKPGTFFSKAYQTYIITIPMFNLKVIRRYSDFEWLRRILSNLFPASVIPPIPKKNKLGGDRFNEEFLEKRRRTLEKFLNLLLEDPKIKVSQIFYDFVSIDEIKNFSDKKKYYNNIKLPQSLKEYKSLNGKLDIKVDDTREKIYQKIKNTTEINQELLSKLNKQIKSLNNEITIVITRLNEIAKNCEELFLNSIKYDEDNDIKISYYELNEMFKHWSNALKKQNTLAYVNIREYFKFSKNTVKSMKDLINTAEINKQNFLKSKKNLISKKEDLFKKGDKTKWDLAPYIQDINANDKNIVLPCMLFNETNTVNNLKQLYGYYLNSVINEFNRLEKIFAFSHKQNLIENAKKEISIISELFKNISDIAVSSPKYNIENILEKINNEKNKNKDVSGIN